MELEEALAAVRNDRVQFVTFTPPGSVFATLERRVVVTGPPELVNFSKTGDVHVLDKLVNLLSESDRAWAAAVLLAAMTGQEAKTVDVFAAHPDQWWDAVGTTAQERWRNWLDETREKLVWDGEDSIFVEAT